MARSAWSTPRDARTPPPTEEQLELLRKVGRALKPSMRVGRSGVDAVAVAKMNAELADAQLVKAQFVGHAPKAVRSMATVLAEKTGSRCIWAHGRDVVLYRLHPNRSFEDLISVYRSR